MPTIQDLSGQQFTDWLVLEFDSIDQYRNAVFLCRCVCGIERTVLGTHLRKGRSTGCGCTADIRFKKKRQIHGMTHSSEYRIWKLMKHRCSSPSYTHYKNYGGRGITVCKEWINSFARFYEDLGPRPSMKHTLDRIDNSGNYEPGNCRWTTRDQQNRNHRRNHILTLNGRSMTVTDWAHELGLTQQALQWRLNNWPIERVLSEPINTNYQR